MRQRIWTRAFLMVALGVASLTATPIISFDAGTGSNGGQNNQSVGWQFNVTQSLTVTGLGWFDDGGDGLAVSHTVGIWDSAGTLLASILVPAGTTAPLDGQYRMVAITPIVLGIGDGYIVGGENFANNTERLAFNVTMTVDPRITFFDATFSGVGSGFVRPTEFSVAETGFFGPMFAVDNVPEPSTWALITSGLLAAAFARRQRK